MKTLFFGGYVYILSLYPENFFYPNLDFSNILLRQGHFILDLGDEFRWFQPSKTKIADAWNGAFSCMHKMSKFRMKQPCTSMRGFFCKLNLGGKQVYQSTFSKANQHRSSQPFETLYQSLNRLVKKKNKPSKDWDICPIDSTTITLTSKVFWALDYHQVKLFSAVSQSQGSCESCVIILGQPMTTNSPPQ